jgi:hypothetical protein
MSVMRLENIRIGYELMLSEISFYLIMSKSRIRQIEQLGCGYAPR